MAIIEKGKQVEGIMTVEKTGQAPVTETEIVGDVVSTQPMANVGYSVAVTKNLGNCEFAKISVSLHVPCLPTGEDIEASYLSVKEWVEDKINQAVAELE